MQNDKPVTKKSVPCSTEKPVIKKISRRKVLKSLFLAPVQFSFFLSAIKAQGSNPGSGSQADNPYTPNLPMGKGQGIIPGRVSWVWNPSTTNPGCANKPVSKEIPAANYDAWFQDKNTSQEKVDQMLIAGLCSMVGKEKPGEAWDAVFRYHNLKRGKGSVPYFKGEKIYIKLNRTSASGGMDPEYRRLEDKPLPLALRNITSDSPFNCSDSWLMWLVYRRIAFTWGMR